MFSHLPYFCFPGHLPFLVSTLATLKGMLEGLCSAALFISSWCVFEDLEHTCLGPRNNKTRRECSQNFVCSVRRSVGYHKGICFLLYGCIKTGIALFYFAVFGFDSYPQHFSFWVSGWGVLCPWVSHGFLMPFGSFRAQTYYWNTVILTFGLL